MNTATVSLRLSSQDAARELLARRTARKSLIGFTEYTNPRYQTAGFHRTIAGHLERVERGEVDRLMLLCPPRHGKALAVATPIATPSGWTTMGELKAGDAVFGSDGKPCKVVSKSEVWCGRECFVVRSDDGDEIVADAEHEWPVRLCRKYKKVLPKTTRYLADRSSLRRPMLAAQAALDLPEAELSIDPYVLGVWLGDGRTMSSGICSADDWIIDELERIEGSVNHYAKVGKTKHFRIGPHYREGAMQSETLQGRLRALALIANKHVPIAYKRASKGQRLSLLQGIVDTDGYVAEDGQIEVCTILSTLAEDVKEIVHSLGHKASIIVGRATLDGVDCGEKYRVMFYMDGAARLPRKAAKCRHGMRAFKRYISVFPTTPRDTVCIEVDSPDHLFLAGRSMLPTHNSELASRRFPAYALGRRPDREFISVSAGADLATDFGRDVRNLINGQEYKSLFPTTLAEDSQAKNKWRTDAGGGYYAVGVGGQFMGRGADILMIDDPFASMMEAQSELARKNVWDWYTGTAYNRLQPSGAVVLINHRMHEDDLSGRILAMQAAGGDRFEVVELPAINDDGEALWPEKYPLDALERIRINGANPRYFSALYQQKPVPDDGDYFKREWLLPVDKIPPRESLRIYGGSDYAVTSSGGDFTVHAVVGLDPDGDPWLLDIWRKQAASDEWVESFCDLVIKWKPVSWAEETGQIKSGVGPFLDREMRNRKAYTSRELFATRGDKAVRAQSFRGMIATRGLRIPANAPWRAEFESELLRFPAGVHDDQVDACGLIGQLLDMMQDGPQAKKPDPPKNNDYVDHRSAYHDELDPMTI